MCEMAEQDFNKLKKLIIEVRKPNRSLLYDLKHINYKNNKLKQIIWAEIAEEMEMTPKDAQGLWKRTKMNAPSGSGRSNLRPIDEFLLNEMSFINQFLDDEEPRKTNYTDSNTNNIQFMDAFAAEVDVSSTTLSSPPPKKKRTEMQILLESSFKKIEQLVQSCKSAQSPPKNKDAFYSYFEQEMESLDPEDKESLKPVILNLIAATKNRKKH